MNISEFVRRYNLSSADEIITKKVGWGILDHPVVYLGRDKNTGEHLFSVNMYPGVRLLNEREAGELLNKYRPDRINRFRGSEYERNVAFNRAISRIGDNNYDILFNNCEHYTSYVRTGRASSRQVQNIAGIAVVGLLIGALLSSE